LIHICFLAHESAVAPRRRGAFLPEGKAGERGGGGGGEEEPGEHTAKLGTDFHLNDKTRGRSVVSMTWRIKTKEKREKIVKKERNSQNQRIHARMVSNSGRLANWVSIFNEACELGVKF
jgi:hypothetical protein